MKYYQFLLFLLFAFTHNKIKLLDINFIIIILSSKLISFCTTQYWSLCIIQKNSWWIKLRNIPINQKSRYKMDSGIESKRILHLIENTFYIEIN